MTMSRSSAARAASAAGLSSNLPSRRAIPIGRAIGEATDDLVEAHACQFGSGGNVEVATAEVGEFVGDLAEAALAQCEGPGPCQGLRGGDRMHRRPPRLDQAMGGRRVGHLDHDREIVSVRRVPRRARGPYASPRCRLRRGRAARPRRVRRRCGRSRDRHASSDHRSGTRRGCRVGPATASITARRSSVGSLCESTTIVLGLRCALASTSCWMITGMRVDPPRITRCPDSITLLRPRRMLSIRSSTPAAMMPMRRAGDQQPEQRDHEGEDPSSPADVAGHRAGVEDPQEALPGVLGQPAVAAPGEGHPEQRQQHCADQHGGKRHQGPARRAPRWCPVRGCCRTGIGAARARLTSSDGRPSRSSLSCRWTMTVYDLR